MEQDRNPWELRLPAEMLCLQVQRDTCLVETLHLKKKNITLVNAIEDSLPCVVHLASPLTTFIKGLYLLRNRNDLVHTTL